MPIPETGRSGSWWRPEQQGPSCFWFLNSVSLTPEGAISPSSEIPDKQANDNNNSNNNNNREVQAETLSVQEIMKRNRSYERLSDSDCDVNGGRAKRPVWAPHNKAQTTDFDQLPNYATIRTPLEMTPWVHGRQGHMYPQTVKGLSDEIEDFCEWVSPTAEEQKMRCYVIEKLRRITSEIWPTCDLQVFGSFRTKLYLPTSDIDVVINFEPLKDPRCDPTRTLRDRLIAAKITTPHDSTTIPTASVPLVKYCDSETDCRVDVSFNTHFSSEAAKTVTRFLAKYSALKPLVLVTKQFLVQRDLNEVYSGGLSSYSLLYLWISYFQTHPRWQKCDTISENVNLGVCLLEFFELYGKLFNYNEVGIRIRCRGELIKKSELQSQICDSRFAGPMNYAQPPKLAGLCIEDPCNRFNDISRGSFDMQTVQRSFLLAYIQLQSAIHPAHWPAGRETPSILNRIIRVTDEVVRYRKWVSLTYASLPELDMVWLHSLNTTLSPDLERDIFGSSSEEGGSSETGSVCSGSSPEPSPWRLAQPGQTRPSAADMLFKSKPAVAPLRSSNPIVFQQQISHSNSNPRRSNRGRQHYPQHRGGPPEEKQPPVTARPTEKKRSPTASKTRKEVETTK